MHLTALSDFKVVYSTMSKFRCANGSQMIEIIPFLYAIVNSVVANTKDVRALDNLITSCLNNTFVSALSICV